MSWAIITASTIGAGISVGGNAILANNSGNGGGSQGPGTLGQIGNFILSQMSAEEQKKALDEYYARADQQRADAMATAAYIGPESLATYDYSSGMALDEMLNLRDRMTTGAQDLYDATATSGQEFLQDFSERGQRLMTGYGAGLGSFLGELGARESDIMGGYEDRYLKAENELETYGEQQAADIDRYFGEQQAASAMDLLNRGLLSSTQASAQAGAVTERQSAEQRRLAEDLMRNRVNVLSGLSGQSLAAQERLGTQRAGYQYGGLNTAMQTQTALDATYAAYDAAMRGDVLAAQRYMMDIDSLMSGNIAGFYGNEAANRSNIVGSGIRDMVNTIMGFDNVPPPQNTTPFQFGYNSGGSPSAASPYPSFLAQAGQGIGRGVYNWMNQPQQTQQQQTQQTQQQQQQQPQQQYFGPPMLAPQDQYQYPISID